MTPDIQNFGSSILDFPPIITMYIPDNSPQNCYINFPNWPHELPSVRRTKGSDDFYLLPAPSYRPYETDKEMIKNFKESLEKLRGEPKEKYFTKTKEILQFHLELAGFAKEDISATVEGEYLTVKSTNSQKPYDKVFIIPNTESYNLTNTMAKMANGLLEIFFAAKKEDVKQIKIL